LGEAISGRLVELLLLLHRPALIPGDLDDHKVVGP
jgi:hypothetical protein